MPAMIPAPVGGLEPAQAAELSLLVELEARWENLRKHPAREPVPGAATEDLRGIQQAYEAFRAKLAAYDRRYKPAHVPELLLNTPSRLGRWCRAMRDLYLRVEHDAKARCPVQLLEKAYRWADRVGARVNKGRVSRPSPPATIRDAIRALEALGRWCDDLTEKAHPGGPTMAAPLGAVPAS